MRRDKVALGMRVAFAAAVKPPCVAMAWKSASRSKFKARSVDETLRLPEQH